MTTLNDRNLIEEALRNWWGQRCTDGYDPGCPSCVAWEQYDKLRGKETHRLRANSVESKS